MHLSRPGAQPFTPRSPRVVAARRLLRRRHRDEEALFLAEGPQAVREALTCAGGVPDLFVTELAFQRHQELIDVARAAGVAVWPITEPGLASLTETVTPQGVVAICRHLHHETLAPVLALAPRLIAVLAGISDPGNAGTVLRTADAAGASAVVFGQGSVDPYNGKCVRASAGSLFHLELVRGQPVPDAVTASRAAGMRVLAADAHGDADLDELADAGELAARTVWVFGSEAHGLAPEVAELADARVKVPVHGRAESLNLAAAAAVCLYASAKAHRHSGAPA